MKNNTIWILALLGIGGYLLFKNMNKTTIPDSPLSWWIADEARLTNKQENVVDTLTNPIINPAVAPAVGQFFTTANVIKKYTQNKYTSLGKTSPTPMTSTVTKLTPSQQTIVNKLSSATVNPSVSKTVATVFQTANKIKSKYGFY